MQELAPVGNKNTAIRIEQALENFAQTVSDLSGCSLEQGRAVTDLYLELRVAKLDAVSGRVSVKHGSFLDTDVIKNALDEVARRAAA